MIVILVSGDFLDVIVRIDSRRLTILDGKFAINMNLNTTVRRVLLFVVCSRAVGVLAEGARHIATLTMTGPTVARTVGWGTTKLSCQEALVGVGSMGRNIGVAGDNTSPDGRERQKDADSGEGP